MKMHLRLSAILLGLFFVRQTPTSAQQVVRYYYPPTVTTAPRYVTVPSNVSPPVVYYQPAPAARNGLLFSGPDLVRRPGRGNIPYTRSPYTDDWSTDRHLPFPKPWMRP